MEHSVKVKTRFDYRTMKYCNFYIIRYKRNAFLIYLIMSILTLGIGGWSLYSSIKAGQPNYIFPIMFAFFAIYMLYQGLSTERSLDRQINNFLKDKKPSVQVSEINDEKILLSRLDDAKDVKPIEVDWAQVTEIHEIPQFYFLYLAKNQPLIIDKNPDCFMEGTPEDLKAIIDEKASSKPYKVVNKEILKHPVEYVHVEDEIEIIDANEIDTSTMEEVNTLSEEENLNTTDANNDVEEVNVEKEDKTEE